MKDVNVEKDEKLVIGYVRESTMEQAVDGFNLEGQQKKIRQYCETFDLGEPTFLVEKGKSGKSLNRSKAKELVNLVKHDKVKTVIVQKLDRLTRNIVDLSELMKLFQAHDVTLVSMYEKFDTNTANGMFAAKLFILLAEQELEQISERTKWGLAESYAQGNYVIGGKVARGYKRVNGKLEIKEEEVPVIKEIFERSANGEPSLPISLDLYARNEFNLKWDERAVISIIKNTLYKGIWVYKGQTRKVPAIVSEDLWQKANDMIETRKRTKRHSYLFSYLFRCSKCNTIMLHDSSTRNQYTSLYYYCPKCNGRINENKLLPLVRDDIIEKVVKDRNAIRLIYQNRISTNSKKISKLEDNMLLVDDPEACNQKIASLEQSNQKLRAKCSEIMKQGLSFDEIDRDILISWLVNNIDSIWYDFDNNKIIELNWKKKKNKNGK